MAKKKTRSGASKKSVEAIQHDEDKRKNIPTAEYQSVMKSEEKEAIKFSFERRNRDLDPQLVWRGKDEQDWSDLVVNTPPLYIQEKVHPKVLIDKLRLYSEKDKNPSTNYQPSLFDQFNGISSGVDRTEFYQHDQNWTNRMILGDALPVLASLAERENLKGQVQCIYIDPPYGIKFNSNFQWSTTSRDVKDGNVKHITREPEQVKAFRDTWRDGVHSYLTYLRDRLTVARDLLADSGSVFVQIGEENVHRVRSLLEEVFGQDNFVSLITVKKTAVQTDLAISSVSDYILWFCKYRAQIKYRPLFLSKNIGDPGSEQYRWIRDEKGDFCRVKNQSDYSTGQLCRPDNLTSSHEYSRGKEEIKFQGKKYNPGGRYWSTSPESIERLGKAGRLHTGGRTLSYVRFLCDFSVMPLLNVWTDTGTGGYGDERFYVVQTTTKIIQRCVLMTTDPGDLVLDPTCGSGTTAAVAEQWGRRWITIDTSRVALALARSRLMGARYPYYLLADSEEGQEKEAEILGKEISSKPTFGKIRQGFVYERVPHVTMKSIANNQLIDAVWDKYSEEISPLIQRLSKELKIDGAPEEYKIPRDRGKDWTDDVVKNWKRYWEIRKTRQQEIDKLIDRTAESETLYDRPYVDKNIVRVSGPFTVESLSPHRMVAVDENDNPIGLNVEDKSNEGQIGFVDMVLENLKTSGVQQSHKEDRIQFHSLSPWPGEFVCAEACYIDNGGDDVKRRAAIFVGPEFGTVTRPDLVEAAREAGDSGFDVLIACAFNFDAHTTEFSKLGKIPILKARMNADLHMADDLKNTGKGNLFVIFGEPDIDLIKDREAYQIKINGVDVFDPRSGEVRSDGPDGIACWFLDTDYNQESFFVRHAYFLGANDPFKSLKKTLKSEIDKEAWESLYSDTSRPFTTPESGRIAVKVINYLGDEVMKVIRVD
jgi:adenine-specific DNA-methyltransferase